MTHPQTTQPPSSPSIVAVEALACQGQYGAVTRLADSHGLTRQRVYRIRDQADAALSDAFTASRSAPDTPTICVDEAHVRRAVVALRVVAPCSIRDIEDLLPELFGVRWSYGKIQSELAEAERRAGDWLGTVDLENIDHIALDEMFSQGRPVLGGIGMDSGYLFALEVSPTRTGAEWAEVLHAMKNEQQLRPGVVVKDAGSGLALGVQLAWPCIEERDDLFHLVYELGKEASYLERRAYGAITKVDVEQVRRRRAKASRTRRSIGQRLRGKVDAMNRRIGRYDRFEELRREAQEWLLVCERGSGRVRDPDVVTAALQHIAAQMMELDTVRIRKVATYLHNRASGVSVYLTSLSRRLKEVAQSVGGMDIVEAVVSYWQARTEVDRGGPPSEQRARREELDSAAEGLVARCWPDRPRLFRALNVVLQIMEGRHRASSVIENMNGVLRPYLVVQKGVQQGFLDLFRFYWNTRKRRWGRRKGTSAVETLRGQPHADWLTLLGYPPAAEIRAAA